jgi:hypothetical protein
MGPPGGPGFGPGIGQAQEQSQKSQIDIAVSTMEKIGSSIQDDTWQSYFRRALAIMKTGAAMAQQQGPQSKPGMAPPPSMAGGQPTPQPQLPPMPGQMPG